MFYKQKIDEFELFAVIKLQRGKKVFHWEQDGSLIDTKPDSAVTAKT